MAFYGYFKNCLEATKTKYYSYKKPSVAFYRDVKEIINQLYTSLQYEEITPEQYRKIFCRNHADEYSLSVLIEEIMKERCHIGFKGFNWQSNTTYVQRSLYHLFKEYYKGGKVTIHKKDKDYDKIRYELEDIRRKVNREVKKRRRDESEKILGYVFERRKERDRIKAAEERARDIITRDRLGFDEYSFKGETKYGEIKERK